MRILILALLGIGLNLSAKANETNDNNQSGTYVLQSGHFDIDVWGGLDVINVIYPRIQLLDPLLVYSPVYTNTSDADKSAAVQRECGNQKLKIYLARNYKSEQLRIKKFRELSSNHYNGFPARGLLNLGIIGFSLDSSDWRSAETRDWLENIKNQFRLNKVKGQFKVERVDEIGADVFINVTLENS